MDHCPNVTSRKGSYPSSRSRSRHWIHDRVGNYGTLGTRQKQGGSRGMVQAPCRSPALPCPPIHNLVPVTSPMPSRFTALKTVIIQSARYTSRKTQKTYLKKQTNKRHQKTNKKQEPKKTTKTPNTKIKRSKCQNPEFQKSKKIKIPKHEQKFSVCSSGFLEFWMFLLLEFWIFGFWDLSLSLSCYSIRVLHLEMSQNPTNKETGFALVFPVF